MKSIYIIVLAFLFSQFLPAQNILVRSVNSDIEYLDEEKIADKFLAACTDDFSYFVVDLELTQLQEEEMKALENKTVVSADLTVKIYSLIDERLLDSKSLKLVSSGSSAAKAKKGLLSALIRKRNSLNKALNEVKDNHPVKDCAQIEKAIDNYIARQAFKEAFTLSNLSGVACVEKLQDLRIKVYNAYQDQYCQAHLQKAEAYLANRQFDAAVQEVVKISPESACKEGIKKLVSELSSKKEEAYSDAYQAYVKYLEMASLERRDRLDIINLLKVKSLLND